MIASSYILFLLLLNAHLWRRLTIFFSMGLSCLFGEAMKSSSKCIWSFVEISYLKISRMMIDRFQSFVFALKIKAVDLMIPGLQFGSQKILFLLLCFVKVGFGTLFLLRSFIVFLSDKDTARFFFSIFKLIGKKEIELLVSMQIFV